MRHDRAHTRAHGRAHARAHVDTAWRPAVRVLVVLALAASCAAAWAPDAHAQTEVAEYRARVAEAREAVEAYIATGARDGGGGTAVAVLTALPSVERVRVGDTVVAGDNSILRTRVARLDVSRDPERRLALARDMAAHLSSIERSLPVEGESLPADPEALERLLSESRATARSPITEILGDLIDRLALAFERWQASLGGAGPVSQVWSIVVGVVVAVLTLVLAVTFYRVAVRLYRSAALRGPAAAGTGSAAVSAQVEEEPLPADVAGAAESLAASGDFAGAVRTLFAGAARTVAERAHVSRARTRTNTELVRAARRSVPDAADPLARLASIFETAVFGHVDPGASGYGLAREAYATVASVAADRGTEDEVGGRSGTGGAS